MKIFDNEIFEGESALLEETYRLREENPFRQLAREHFSSIVPKERCNEFYHGFAHALGLMTGYIYGAQERKIDELSLENIPALLIIAAMEEALRIKESDALLFSDSLPVN
jgi:hypothetical protein